MKLYQTDRKNKGVKSFPPISSFRMEHDVCKGFLKREREKKRRRIKGS